MSSNEKQTKVIQELFDSKVLGTSQNPAKEIQKLKDLVNLQYEYDTGNASSASQQPTTKETPKSKSNAPSLSKQSTATRRPTSTSTASSASKQSTTTRPPTSTNGKQSSRDPVQDLFTDRARKLETEKKEKEAAEKAERKAKAVAKKEATSVQQAAAISQQAKYAKEEKERMAEAKMAKERVLKKIEADKVERKEREEQRKQAARIEAQDVSRGSVSTGPKQAYTTRTMPRSVSSRPNPTSSSRSLQPDIRLPGSQVPPLGRSLASRHPTAGTSHGKRLDGESADEEYQDDEGYLDEEYSDQGYTPRNINNQKPGQRHPPPRSVIREINPGYQGYASLPLPRSGSSRPSRCPGVRLGGPSPYIPLTPSLTHGPRHRPRAIIPPCSHVGPTPRCSHPSPHPRRNRVIEDFDMHESATERPKWTRDMDKVCPHLMPSHCSHCGGGVTIVCMPCVVRGCKGQWCEDCWDKMVARKRAMGARVTRPPGWQECPYRSNKDQKEGCGHKWVFYPY